MVLDWRRTWRSNLSINQSETRPKKLIVTTGETIPKEDSSYWKAFLLLRSFKDLKTSRDFTWSTFMLILSIHKMGMSANTSKNIELKLMELQGMLNWPETSGAFRAPW